LPAPKRVDGMREGKISRNEGRKGKLKEGR
jgi:hypothetical protein